MKHKPSRITDEARDKLRILFIAKHALGGGELHKEDGNHALYHHEVRSILESLGLNLVVTNNYDMLLEKPDVDFVFPLLNRAGFFNSEMLLPLLCERHGIRYLGASPILRGLSDDKHLTKLEGRAHGVPTCDWAIFRRGAPVDLSGVPDADRWVIKPNASSASWGVQDAHDIAGIETAIANVHADGHDALVEPFMPGSDVEIPVVTLGGEPHVMPPMLFKQADPSHLRTYYEKRDLVPRAHKYELVGFEDQKAWARIREMTLAMAEIFRPFDYGRFEFRYDEASGEINLLEVNLNCNLWSKKVYGQSALLIGWTQEELIETILAESLVRNGLMEKA